MEINIIIPAAGKSSRFNTGKPKWMRTHPDGRLMIEHSVDNITKLEGVKCNIYVITLQEIEEKHNAISILTNTSLSNVEIILLRKETSSPAETILQGVNNSKSIDISLPTILKDSDNYINLNLETKDFNENFSVGCDLNSFEIKNVSNKSFLIYNSLMQITDFVEKRVVSDTISVGTHCLNNFSEFLVVLENCIMNQREDEIFISHIISEMILRGEIFKIKLVSEYKDFGTQNEWNEEMFDHRSYFVDFDGTLVKNKGAYGKNNWYELNDKPISKNIELLVKLRKKGAKVYITTSRKSSLEKYIREFLFNNGLEIDGILCDLPHSSRVIINDFANTNPYPSAIAINIPRNGNLESYLNNHK